MEILMYSSVYSLMDSKNAGRRGILDTVKMNPSQFSKYLCIYPFSLNFSVSRSFCVFVLFVVVINFKLKQRFNSLSARYLRGNRHALFLLFQLA